MHGSTNSKGQTTVLCTMCVTGWACVSGERKSSDTFTNTLNPHTTLPALFQTITGLEQVKEFLFTSSVQNQTSRNESLEQQL